MENKAEKLNCDELRKATGGRDGEFGFVGDCKCSSCGKVNEINAYCYSGQSTKIYQFCNRPFVIRF